VFTGGTKIHQFREVFWRLCWCTLPSMLPEKWRNFETHGNPYLPAVDECWFRCSDVSAAASVRAKHPGRVGETECEWDRVLRRWVMRSGRQIFVLEYYYFSPVFAVLVSVCNIWVCGFFALSRTIHLLALLVRDVSGSTVTIIRYFHDMAGACSRSIFITFRYPLLSETLIKS
jgi:hypothetical protein